MLTFTSSSFFLSLMGYSAMSCSVLSLVGNRFAGSNQYLPSILNGLGSPTLQCVLGSRLFFNLKEAGERGVNEGTNWGSHTVVSMDFSKKEGDGTAIRYVESLSSIERGIYLILLMQKRT